MVTNMSNGAGIKALLFWLALATAVPISLADETSPQRAEATKIVDRLYQSSEGAAISCAQAPEKPAREFSDALAHFQKTHPRLISLMRSSPSYESARLQFAKNFRFDASRDHPDQLTAQCRYFASLLNAMSDSPEGREAAKDFESKLEAAITH